MLDGKKAVLDWFERTGCKYWWIYYGKSEGGNFSDKSSDSEDATPATAMSDLSLALAHKTGTYVMVASNYSKPAPKGNHREDIRLTMSDNLLTSMQPVAGIGNAGISETEVQNRINAAVQSAMDALEMKRLREENKELRQQVEDQGDKNPWNQVGSVLSQYVVPYLVPALIGNGAPVATAKVAGLNAVPGGKFHSPSDQRDMQEDINEIGNTATEDDNAKLEKVVQIFSTIDPDGWLDKLVLLAEKVEAKPALLNMINML